MGLFNFLDPALDIVLGPLTRIDPFLGMGIISILISLIVLLIQKAVTDQKRMKELKDKTKEFQEEMKKHKNNPEKMMAKQQEMMAINMEMMKHSFRPMIFTFIPSTCVALMKPWTSRPLSSNASALALRWWALRTI